VWPFGRKKVAGRLAAASARAAAAASGEAVEPVRVSLLATVASSNAIVSPFTGLRGAILHVELVERFPRPNEGGRYSEDLEDQYQSLGVVVLGDVVTLRDEDGDEINLVVGRTRVDPSLPRRGGTPLSRAPAEVVPLLQRATGRGVVCYRELLLREGESVRLKAIVEPTQSVVTSGYRAGTRVSYVARDDLEPVVLEEVFEAPPW
jgi:hypothetical protein